MLDNPLGVGTQMDAFAKYDTQPSRHYRGLDTDSPERWHAFAASHANYKPAEIVEEKEAHHGAPDNS